MRKFLSLTLLGTLAAMAQTSGPLVTEPALTGVSAPLEDIARFTPAGPFDSLKGYFERNHTIPKPTTTQTPLGFIAPPNLSVSATNSTRQTSNFQPMGVTVGANFEGLGVGTPSFGITGAPPDTTMAVSSTQVVQWVNTQLAIYDKTGTKLLPGSGFVNGNTIWSALGASSLCATTNNGDPLVQYDKLANRWILSQFAFNATNTLNSQCFAVSTSSNALGSYALYEYSFGNSLPDYGKLGVWPNAYFATYNMFGFNGTNFTDLRSCAYDRAAMLNGAAATQVCFANPNEFSALPSDLDGTTPPPVGTPNFIITWDWPVTVSGPYTMRMHKFVPNFTTPANSTFNDGVGGAAFSFVSFPLSAATLGPCNDGSPNACVPQLGTAQQLDSLGDRHMYRLVYRNFGGYDSLLITQAVDDNNTATASAQVRWIEIRNPNANPPVVYQNSTYAPDATFRWMSSGAFDKLGNIAIGFSASSSSMNPAIRIAGRRKTDPINLLRTEQTVQAGSGSQTTGLSRWGDYSTMQVDPANDCTFWYTTEYIGANGTFNWRTRIVSFKYPNCN